jgi:FkbM family methyltransferase
VDKLYRKVVSNVPWIMEFKYFIKAKLSQYTRTPMESYFNALRLFKFPSVPVCLDIGANRGQCIKSLRQLFDNCQIHSFEPNPVLFEKLETMFDKDKRIVLYNCGLSSMQGSFDLFVPLYNGVMFDGLGTGSAENAIASLKHRISKKDWQKVSTRKFECRVDVLDSFNLSPHFVKIDVEGHETEVLKGSRETIAKSKPVFLVESSSWDIIHFLSQFGYEYYDYKNGKLHRNAYGKDNTFILHPHHIKEINPDTVVK